MLEQLLEMTSFNSQTCLALGEEFIKYFSKNFRHIASNLTTAEILTHTASQSIAACTVTLHLMT